MIFCVTCLGREDQLLTATLVNCPLWWTMRAHWRLVIVTFGEDERAVRMLRDLAAPAIASGNLVLASGGKAGVARAMSGAVVAPRDMPHWMPEKPNPSVCESEKEASRGGMPRLQYWHASVAKNTSHMVGIHMGTWRTGSSFWIVTNWPRWHT